MKIGLATRVGLAAALMLSASSAVMAAKVSNTPGAAGTGVTAVLAGNKVAEEQFGTSQLGDPAIQTDQQVLIIPSVAGAFTQAQMVVTFTIAGAKILDPLTSSSLTCTAGAANINLSSGGTAGSQQVVFLVDTAQACTDLVLSLGKLDTVTADVTVSATLKNNTNLDIDNGITNNPVVYAARVNGITGSAPASFAFDIDLPGGSTKLTPTGQTNAGGTRFVTQALNLTVGANGANLAAINTLLTAANLPGSGVSGVVTLNGLPNGTTAVSLVTGADANTPAGAATGATCVLAVPTATCTLNQAGFVAWATTPVNALITIDGTTVVSPTDVLASAVGKYPAPYQTTDDVLFSNQTVARIGSGACAAEFASVIGTNPYSFLSTIRMSNTSATKAKVYATVTNDAGTHNPGGAVRLTIANTAAGNGLTNDATLGDVLAPGATIEVNGKQLETATGLAFGNRGRVRMFVETKGTTSGASLVGNINVNGAGTGLLAFSSGCTAEGFVCSGSVCSVMQQTGSGKDGNAIAAQKN